MVSIRVKLFSKKKKKSDNGGKPIYHDFRDLREIKDKFPNADPNKKSSEGNIKSKNPKIKSDSDFKSNPSSKNEKRGTETRSQSYKSSGSRTTKTTSTTQRSSNKKLVKTDDNKFQELVNKYKNDPDFKKKVNTGGFITLGTALTAGAAIGGAKLIKNKKKEINNNRVKNSILINDEEKNEE